MERSRSALLVGALGALALSACGGDTATSTATTMRPLTSTAFATVPPVVATTIDPANTVPPEQEYTIQAGDYLYGIATKFGVTADEIVAYNAWPDGLNHPLNPGDVIKIPPGGTVATVAPGTNTTAVTIVGGQTSTTLATGASGTYTVEAGDYLYSIAQKFDTTPEAIAAANGWADGVNHPLYPGDIITIP